MSLSRHKSRSMPGLAFALILGAFLQPAFGQDPVIDSSRGVDDNVDYAALTKFGPWDDRNYDLTAADVALLPKNDRFIRGVPAFYKVQKRKEMAASGFPLGRHYPREIDKEFQIRHGGLMINGELQRSGLGIYTHPDPKNPPPKLRLATDAQAKAVPIEGEGPFDGTASDNETTIEYNPANPNQVVAGSNGSGGQRHSYSSDGGATWMSSGALPNSCCDPAMDWAPDGSVVYTATLGRQSAGGGGPLQTEIYWSTNAGQTWQGPVNVSTAGSDKEFIHVDRAPGSPHLGQLYATWHQGNVMQFARCNYNNGTNMLDCDPTQSFGSEERGIGSDITSDHLGNVYYFWPTVTDGSTEIRVKVSTDGGATFAPSVEVFDLWGDFDFPVPSMETRRAFIYVAAAADRSGGPRNGRIYAAFTDKHPSSPAGPGGAASANHAWVQVAYSDDQGATWTTATTPHSEADIATVDRYHPWIDVDAVGNVHIGFYDTRNSSGRTGVDWYYAFSPDGGDTWIEETRVSAIVSQNINDGQEWGDYNGLSASTAATIAMTWTDNRITPPASNPVQSSYAARVTNVAIGPTFVMGATGTSNVSLCSGDPVENVEITLTGFQGFTDPVTLTTPGLDTNVFPSATFTPNPVTPTAGGATATLEVATDSGAPSGSYSISVEGNSPPPPAPNTAVGGVTRSLSFGVDLFADQPGTTTLVSPADMATNVSLTTVLTWDAITDGETYLVEIDDNPGFTNPITATLSGTSFTTTALLSQTEYYWRVTASNTCGDGNTSEVRSFTTAPLPGDCNVGNTVSTEYQYGFESGAGGWTSSGTGDTWAQSGDRVNSGSFSWKAVDPTSTSDQRLVSPVIPVPSGQSPLTMQFFHYRDIENRGDTQCWDAGIVEYSTDAGGSWTQFTNAQLLTDPYNGEVTGGPLTGLNGYCNLQDWTRSIVDIEALAGQSVQFRFRLGSDSSVGAEGWYIDDVRVQSCLDSSFIYRDGFE